MSGLDARNDRIRRGVDELRFCAPTWIVLTALPQATSTTKMPEAVLDSLIEHVGERLAEYEPGLSPRFASAEAPPVFRHGTETAAKSSRESALSSTISVSIMLDPTLISTRFREASAFVTAQQSRYADGKRFLLRKLRVPMNQRAARR